MPFAKKLGLAGAGTSLVVAGALLVGGSAGAAPTTANAPAAPSIEGENVTIGNGSAGIASITCPAGSIITGGGGRTSGSRVFLTDSYKDGNGWAVIGTNTSTSSQTIRAVAVCESTS